MTKDPTVFIVESDEPVRSTLGLLFKSLQMNVETFSNGLLYLQQYDSSRRGCIVVDIRMPEMNGIELQEQLNNRGNTLPIIFLSAQADVPMAVSALKLGAHEFITKPFHNQKLLEIVRKTVFLNVNQKDTLTLSDIYNRFEHLTRREQEVFLLVVEGKLNKQIAEKLNITSATGEIHRANVMQTMQAKTLAALVKMSILLENN